MSGRGGAELARVIRLRRGGMRRARRRLSRTGRLLARAAALLALPLLSLWVAASAGQVHAAGWSDDAAEADGPFETPDGAFSLEPAPEGRVAAVPTGGVAPAAPAPAAAPAPDPAAPDLARFDSY